MLMGIPVRGGCLHYFHDLLPGLKVPAFEGQGTQDLPPGLDEELE